MLLYRVCPVDPAVNKGSPYHPAYVPPSSGQHRIDNADRYDTLYVSGSAPAAIAERFGAFSEWGGWMLDHPRGFAVQLVTFDLDPDRPVLDLDDAAMLLDRSLRPSRVVTRDRRITHAWAARVYDEDRWAGVSWWSYYNPDWTSCGLWCRSGARAILGLTVVEVQALGVEHPAMVEAREALLRPWVR